MTSAHHKIPAACHTYSKGDDQFPATAPRVIVRGKGCYLWGEDGRRFLDWTMGLASVSLGHAYDSVTEAAREWLDHGSNFARPSPLEEKLADAVLALSPCAEMVKFGKHGSDGTSAAVRLARAFTGRRRILACDSNPFYSVHDWWIGTTAASAGIPREVAALTHKFPFGDIAAFDHLLEQYRDDVACVIVEPAATTPPAGQNLCVRCGGGTAPAGVCGQASFWQQVAERTRAAGALMILDENKTGFRMGLPGAETFYGMNVDLVCYGKAMANGFSVSALAGRGDVMDQGGILQQQRERVFLLSTTHGGETHSLAAAIKTIEIMRQAPVVEHIWGIGNLLRDRFNDIAGRSGLAGVIGLQGYGCFPALVIEAGDDSMSLRTLLLQEMARRGVLFNFIAPSYSHDAAAVEETMAAAEPALAICREALDRKDIATRLVGPPVRPVFRRRN